jgi:4-amino-4-deoxy-L-arabinose transferase-like glycosyltransferase
MPAARHHGGALALNPWFVGGRVPGLSLDLIDKGFFGMSDWRASRIFGQPILTVIVILGFALRLAAAFALPDQHFGDADEYRVAGAALWATGRLNHPLYMPLYPALIGLTGPGFGQMLADIALSTATIALVHQTTLTVFADRAAANLAALATAVYPYFIFYAVVGLTETLFIFLLLAAFLCWYRGQFAGAGVFAVLSILTKPTIDILVPLLIVYFALVVHRLPLRQTLRHLAVYALIYCLLLSPWWLHNYRDTGTFIRLNSGSGMMLYTGNNPHNQTGGALDTDADRDQFLTIRDPVVRDRAMWAAGIAYIKDNPGRFIELAGLKFVRFWRLWPYAPDYGSRLYVVMSLVSFVPVLALSMFYGFVSNRRELFNVVPILLLIGYVTAIHMVLAASLRYRLPLEPFLICFAATVLVRVIRRRGTGRAMLAWVGLR